MALYNHVKVFWNGIRLFWNKPRSLHGVQNLNFGDVLSPFYFKAFSRKITSSIYKVIWFPSEETTLARNICFTLRESLDSVPKYTLSIHCVQTHFRFESYSLLA